MLVGEFAEGADYAALHLQEGFAIGEAEVAGGALHYFPSWEFVEGFETAACPAAEVAFVQTFVDVDFSVGRYADRCCSLLGALHR